MSWEKFASITDRFFPSIRMLHPLTCHRFDARTPREEPAALAAHAEIRPGGGWQQPLYREHATRRAGEA